MKLFAALLAVVAAAACFRGPDAGIRTTVANTAVALTNGVAALPRGRGGVTETTMSPAQGQAVDAANGNKVCGLPDTGILIFRTTAASTDAITVFADANGAELSIDTVTAPSNAGVGGVIIYSPPSDVDWRNHNTTNAAATGCLVFKAATANVVASALIPNR